MKKLLIILFSFFIIFISGCSKIPISFNNKPSISYYSKELLNKYKLDGLDKVTAFEVNYSKERPVDEKDAEIINKFLTSVDNSSYISKPSDLPEKSKYKFFIDLKNNDKYVIAVYDEKYVSIYPWDGKYPPDYIDMTNVHTLYNLYGLSKYLFPKI